MYFPFRCYLLYVLGLSTGALCVCERERERTSSRICMQHGNHSNPYILWYEFVPTCMYKGYVTTCHINNIGLASAIAV